MSRMPLQGNGMAAIPKICLDSLTGLYVCNVLSCMGSIHLSHMAMCNILNYRGPQNRFFLKFAGVWHEKEGRQEEGGVWRHPGKGTPERTVNSEEI